MFKIKTNFLISLVSIIFQFLIINQLCAATPKLKYADFESGFFEPSYTWGDSANGASIIVYIFEGGFKSDYCLKADYTFGGWGCGFQLWSDAGANKSIDCSGAKAIEFWIKLPKGATFFVGFNDGDGEQWCSDGLEQLKSGWQHYVVPLEDLSITPHAGNQNGNKEMDLQAVKGMQFTISKSPQKKAKCFLMRLVLLELKEKSRELKKFLLPLISTKQ